MCSPIVDCKTCPIIETCRRVANAFPTAAEEEAAMSKNMRTRYRNAGRKGAKKAGRAYRKYPQKLVPHA